MESLAFWFQVIIASESLLEFSMAHLNDEGFDGELKRFYSKHLEDEKHHAKWLREDLGDTPINLHMTAAALAGTQYYLARHVHPVCLMGYMQALEGRPMDMKVVEAIEAEHGSKAVRTLRIHAENDPNHIKELLAFHIPDEYMGMVEISKAQTLRYLEGV